jgi:hypothetical protein
MDPKGRSAEGELKPTNEDSAIVPNYKISNIYTLLPTFGIPYEIDWSHLHVHLLQ